MLSSKSERFWRGTIRSRPHAEKVIRYAAGTFVVLAALSALTLLQNFSVGKVLTVLIIGMPALSFHRRHGTIAVSLLLGLCAFAVALAFVAAVYEATGGDNPDVAFFMLAVGAFWLVLGYVAWRGFEAARFLKANPLIPVTDASAL